MAVEATGYGAIADVLADLEDPDGAEAEMATGRELWSATRADHFGDLDRPAALLALRRGTPGRCRPARGDLGRPLGGRQPVWPRPVQHCAGRRAGGPAGPRRPGSRPNGPTSGHGELIQSLGMRASW